MPPTRIRRGKKVPSKKKETSKTEDDLDKPEIKELKCFVCLESYVVKNFNHDYLNENSHLKIPDQVLNQLEPRLPKDVIQTIKNPSSRKNCFCRHCSKMSKDIVGLCSLLESITIKIEDTVSAYADRILNCREIEDGPDKTLPLITLSKNCFEDDFDVDDDGFPEFHSDTNDYSQEKETEDFDIKFPIPSTSGASAHNSSTIVPRVTKRQSGIVAQREGLTLAPKRKRGRNIRKQPKSDQASLYNFKEVSVWLRRIESFKFKCKVCAKMYFSPRSMLEHRKIHIRITELKCPNCKIILTEKPATTKVKLQPGQCYMACDGCKKAFVFEKKVAKTNPISVNTAESIKENQLPTIEIPKPMVKTYQSKNASAKTDSNKNETIEYESCNVCNVPVLKTFMRDHMKHYHPNAQVESDPEVEVVAVKIQHKLVTKKPKPPEVRTKRTVHSTPLKCITCKNQLTVPTEIIGSQMLTLSKKFPSRALMYCSHCKMAFVVGGKTGLGLEDEKSKLQLEVLAELNKYKCTDCGGVFATQYVACYHKNLKCRNIKRTCHLCNNRGYQNAYDLRSHVEQKHPTMEKSLWNICAACGDSYGNEKSHQSCCSQTYGKLCEKCGGAFFTDKLLLRHLEAKHGIKRGLQYPKYRPLRTKKAKRDESGLCENCGKQCKNLSKHIKKCAKLKKKKSGVAGLCENCGKQCKNLSEHIKKCAKLKKMKFQCSQCQNKHGDPIWFENERKLKAHVRLYHVVVHKCDQCGKGFSQISNLKLHVAAAHKDKDLTG